MPRKLVSRATSPKICAAGNLIKKSGQHRDTPLFADDHHLSPLSFGVKGGTVECWWVWGWVSPVVVLRSFVQWKAFTDFIFLPLFSSYFFFQMNLPFLDCFVSSFIVFSSFFVCCLCDFGFALFLYHFSIRFASLRAHVRSTRWQHCQSVLPGLEKDDVWQFCPFTIFFATISKVEIHP